MEITNLRTILQFDGVFSKKVSAHDIIRVVGGQAVPRSTWKRIFDKHKDQLAEHLDSMLCLGYKKKSTPTLNLTGILLLLNWIPDETGRVEQFCELNAEKLIGYLSTEDNHEDSSIPEINETEDLDMNDCDDFNQDEEVDEEMENADISSSENLYLSQLQFQGIFQGRENEIRITGDNKVSVLDIIRVVGGQNNASLAWKRILDKHESEVISFCNDWQFDGERQRDTPVISVHGLVKLLMWIPGETAKQFRAASAEILVRYLGGDLTLIDEVRAIKYYHEENPENIAAIFCEEVVNRNNVDWVPTEDEINEHHRLMIAYADKSNAFYQAKCAVEGDPQVYGKFGQVGSNRVLSERVSEHKRDFPNRFCLYQVLPCTDAVKAESNYKTFGIVKQHKRNIKLKNGKTLTEIILLTNTATQGQYIEAGYKAAGDLLIEPPPYYQAVNGNQIVQSNDSVEIEREKTRQMEIEANEKTKQMDIEANKEIALAKTQNDKIVALAQTENGKEIILAEIALRKLELELQFKVQNNNN